MSQITQAEIEASMQWPPQADKEAVHAAATSQIFRTSYTLCGLALWLEGIDFEPLEDTRTSAQDARVTCPKCRLHHRFWTRPRTNDPHPDLMPFLCL